MADDIHPRLSVASRDEWAPFDCFFSMSLFLFPSLPHLITLYCAIERVLSNSHTSPVRRYSLPAKLYHGTRKSWFLSWQSRRWAVKTCFAYPGRNLIFGQYCDLSLTGHDGECCSIDRVGISILVFERWLTPPPPHTHTHKIGTCTFQPQVARKA
jgi:hypothetical protein